MNCPECGEESNSASTFVRGYCGKCDIKKRTCTVCGEQVARFKVCVLAEEGKEIGRGHKECLQPTERG